MQVVINDITSKIFENNRNEKKIYFCDGDENIVNLTSPLNVVVDFRYA